MRVVSEFLFHETRTEKINGPQGKSLRPALKNQIDLIGNQFTVQISVAKS
jgi:hypothetical protein